MLVLFSALLWTNVLATFCDIVTNGDPDATEFHQLLASVNQYLDANMIADEVRHRVREYLYYVNQVKQEKGGADGLAVLSPTLRGDLIFGSPSFLWLRKVWILRGCEDGFLVALPQAMTAKLYAPFELPERHRFYVLIKGVLINGGKLVTSGGSVETHARAHTDRHSATYISCGRSIV